MWVTPTDLPRRASPVNNAHAIEAPFAAAWRNGIREFVVEDPTPLFGSCFPQIFAPSIVPLLSPPLLRDPAPDLFHCIHDLCRKWSKVFAQLNARRVPERLEGLGQVADGQHLSNLGGVSPSDQRNHPLSPTVQIPSPGVELAGLGHTRQQFPRLGMGVPHPNRAAQLVEEFDQSLQPITPGA